jgi:NAD(P)H dehydrogenase (quinone)
MIPLLHLGMLIVGVPYSTEGMIHTEARDGATTISGRKGELAPTPEDLAICQAQGKCVAELAKKIRS